MTAKYGVGILGAGWVAGEYVKAFRDHPLPQVVGIYNRTPAKATALMRTHRVEGCEYSSLEEFFRDDRINVVVEHTGPRHVDRLESEPETAAGEARYSSEDNRRFEAKREALHDDVQNGDS